MLRQRRLLSAFRLLCLGSSALWCLDPVPARAQTTSLEKPETAQKAFKTPRDFDIGSGSLNDALHAWASISKLKIFASSGALDGRTTRGITGAMTPEAALKQLLAGTSLKFGIVGKSTVSVFDPSSSLEARAQSIALDTINVDGGTQAPVVNARENVTGPVDGFVATQTATGTKSSTPIVEVPQSISVVPQAQITAQGAQNVKEALRYTAGVFTDALGAGDFSSTFMRVRGFKADLYLDGTRLPNPPSSAAYPEIEPYNLERIEVLRGPASGLYGSSGPGGIINMTSKRPLDVPQHEIAVQGGSFDRKQIQFDFSDRFNGSPNSLFRVVGLFRDSGNQINFLEDNRQFIAPSLTIKNDTTKLTLLASYFRSEGTWNFYNYMPASGTILPNPNGRIGMRTNYGEPSVDHLKREQYTAGYEFEHKLGDAWTFRQNTRYMKTDYAQSAVGPARPGSLATSNDPRTGLAFGDPTLRNVNRGQIYLAADNDNFTIDNQIEGKFNTGPLARTLVVGFDYRHLESNYDYITKGRVPPLDIFNPVYGGAILPVNIPLQVDEYKLEQSGLYFQDQIKFNGWIMTLGGRNDWAVALTDNKLDPTRGFFGPRNSKFTGRAGLGYEFANGVVPYVSYATSFDPTVGAAFGGAAFKPTTGEQYEAGVKYQPPGTKTLITAAVFDITQQNVLTRDPVNIGFSVQTGELNVKGFEFEARTEVMPKLNIIAAYTYLDAEITKSNVIGQVGQRPNFTPEHQASLWAQVGFSGPYWDGLTVGAGVRYVGDTVAFQPGVNYGGAVGFVDPFVLVAPDYTLFDAMLSYDLVHLSRELAGAKFQINATNLFDKYYIAACSSVIQCGFGQSRTVLATLSYKW